MQLQSLRRELEQTVSDWKESETDRQSQDLIIRNTTIELSKEKEKSMLLKTQVALLEDRMKVCVIIGVLSVY